MCCVRYLHACTFISGSRSLSARNGAGPISLHYVRCSGGETRLIDCPASSQRCTHSRDVGVSCANCASGDIRLQGGNATSGRVEFCRGYSRLAYPFGRYQQLYYSKWGTVCDDFWDAMDAQVACRQLGFEILGKVHS